MSRPLNRGRRVAQVLPRLLVLQLHFRKIDFAAVRDVGKRPQGLLLTVVINWLVKPFTMAALGVLFFRYLFADWVDPQSASEFRSGVRGP